MTGSAASPPGLRWSALLAMAATGFVIIVTETLPAGLLPQIADGLAVGQAGAGQIISAYAVGTVLAALPAVTLTLGVRRKPLLVVGIVGFLLANAATAAVSSYAAALTVRFVAGAFSGLMWGITPGYARRTAPPALAGRALSIAMLGTPLALSVGTPLGTFAGSLVSWRVVFTGLSVVSLALLVWVVLSVPDAAGAPRDHRSDVRSVLAVPGVAGVLAVVVGWMLAHNPLYSYIAPLLRALGSSARVDVVLLAFGLSSIAGIWVTGILVDRALRALVVGCLAGFALAGQALALARGVPVVLYAAVVACGLTFGGASTQLDTAAADAALDAGSDGDVSATLITTVWNLAILDGGLLGGSCSPALERWPCRGAPWCLLRPRWPWPPPRAVAPSRPDRAAPERTARWGRPVWSAPGPAAGVDEVMPVGADPGQTSPAARPAPAGGVTISVGSPVLRSARPQPRCDRPRRPNPRPAGPARGARGW